ncbi:MAG: DNA gyrase inhibitor YacG [Methylophilaceae bacterium]
MQSEDNPVKKRLVTCPQCKALVEFSSDNPYRPFCSKRCKMIDLGEWASESYTIPEAIKPEDLLEE